MATSLLIFGSSARSRSERAQKIAEEISSPFDTIVAEESGIENVRTILSKASRKPLSGKTICLIFPEVQELSIEAQNTLLKAVEEPNPSVQIILTSPSPFALIPTLASRCQELDLGVSLQTLGKGKAEEFSSFFSLSFGSKINFAEELDLEAWESFWRGKLLDNLKTPKLLPSIVGYLRTISKTRQFLAKRANVKLAKINLILRTPIL